MRANLQQLAKVVRPISDERARELVRGFEAEAGSPGNRFVAAETDLRDDYWARDEAMTKGLRAQHVYG